MRILLLFILLFQLSACKQTGGEDASSGFGVKIPDLGQNGSGGGASANLLSIVSGDGQTVGVGGQALIPLTVLVLQAPGQPAANQTVFFSVVGGASNGSVSTLSSISDASGYAQVNFIAGTTIGKINIVASSPQGSVNFTITVNGASGYSLNKAPSSDGDFQEGTISSNLMSPFRVIVTDASSMPVAGQTVRFMAVGAILGNFSGGIFYDATTDASGIAQSDLFTLNSSAGLHSISAFLMGDSSLHTTFTAEAKVPPAAAISPSLSTLAISNGMVAANGLNTVTLTLKIKDQYGNLIPNSTYGGLINVSRSPFDLGTIWEGSGWSYVSTGTYTRDLTVGNFTGTISFAATVNSISLTSVNPTLQLTTLLSMDPSKTTLAVSVEPLMANGVSTTTIIAMLRDQFSNPIDLPGQTLALSTSAGTLVGGTMVYHAPSGTYRQTLLSPTSVGTGSLTITLQTVNGAIISGITKNITLKGGTISQTKSSLVLSSKYFTNNGLQTLTLYLRDANNNPILEPATFSFNSVIVNGSSNGTFQNGGIPISYGNGQYSIDLKGPSSCTGAPCLADVSATATVDGSIVTLGPIRVQYGSNSITPSASYSYVVMNNQYGKAGFGESVLTGTIYLRKDASTPLNLGGDGALLSVTLGACLPTYDISDNDNGTYSFAIYSTNTSCSGTAEVRYNGSKLTYTPGGYTPNPIAFAFFSDIGVSQSLLSVSPNEFEGNSTATASLTLKDTNALPIPTCAGIDLNEFQFMENGDTQFIGTPACTVVGGNATIYQTIERPVAPAIDFENVTISVKRIKSGVETPFTSTANLTITPTNLKGLTIDCSTAAYEDQNIYVNAGTLTINGWVDGAIPNGAGCPSGRNLRFKKVVVGPTGIITSSHTTPSKKYGVAFEATDYVEIKGGGKIDVSGKGYPGGEIGGDNNGYGPLGATVNGAGSHGGVGRISSMRCVAESEPYGGSSSNYDPNDLGSGGASFIVGSTNYKGSHGGGLIKIKSPHMIVNGDILANGMLVSPGSAIQGCGGAGGSIKLDLTLSPGVFGEITGNGNIYSKGSDGHTNAKGSGGRISLLADIKNFTGSISAIRGGAGATTEVDALASGTLYIEKTKNSFTLPHSLILDKDHGGSYIGKPSDGNDFDLVIPPFMTLSLYDELEAKDVTNSGIIHFLTNNFLRVQNLTNMEESLISHEKVTASNFALLPRVSIEASSTFELKATAKIDVSGSGYPGSDDCGRGDSYYSCYSRWDRGTNAIAIGRVHEGGVHFTLGGLSTASGPTATYGDSNNPTTYGGGGSSRNSSYSGGRGGGVIYLEANTIIVNGEIFANGKVSKDNIAAGGAGGSIQLVSSSLSGSGSLIAKGGDALANSGNNASGGGAGGLIKIFSLNNYLGLGTDVSGGKSVVENNPYVTGHPLYNAAYEAQPGVVTYETGP